MANNYFLPIYYLSIVFCSILVTKKITINRQTTVSNWDKLSTEWFKERLEKCSIRFTAEINKAYMGHALGIAVRIMILGLLLTGSANAATLMVCKSGCAYSSIQAAITVASNGDTILVQSGTYYENVNVNKQLALYGIGMPVVDAMGGKNVITLSADGIKLEGFTVTGSGGDFLGACIKVTSNNSTLSGNYVSNKEYAISLFSSSNNTLSGNYASNNEYGISLSSSSNNNLSGNNVSLNDENGISLDSSNNNTVSGNYELNNYYGISLFESSNNTLRGNYASNDGYGGYGIHLSYYSNNNTLSGNNVTSKNNEYGIYLESSSNNNTLNGNNASSNYYGIYLLNSTNNTLSGNNASNNYYGIYLSSSSNNNTLSGNNVISNNKYGIFLESSSNNNIYNNYFNNANNAKDDGNNIWNIKQTSGTNIINGAFLGGNFWSNYAGKDTDRDGLGDTMLPCNSSGRIANGGDYLPLTVPIPFAFNISGIPVIGHVTSNILNVEYTNSSSGEAYNISIIAPNGTSVTSSLKSRIKSG